MDILVAFMIEIIDSRSNPNAVDVIVNNGKCVFEVPKSMLKTPDLVEAQMLKSCTPEMLNENE